MASLEIFGYLAGFIVALSLTPQVIKSWKTRSTKDISLLWTPIYVLGLSLWYPYAFSITSWPLIVTVTIEIGLAITLLTLKIRYG